jgi:hypothetical protein
VGWLIGRVLDIKIEQYGKPKKKKGNVKTRKTIDGVK